MNVHSTASEAPRPAPPRDARLSCLFMLKAVVGSWIAGLLAFDLVLLRPILAYGWITPRELILPLVAVTFIGYLLGLSILLRSQAVHPNWKQPQMMMLLIHHELIFGLLIALIDPRGLLFVPQ